MCLLLRYITEETMVKVATVVIDIPSISSACSSAGNYSLTAHFDFSEAHISVTCKDDQTGEEQRTVLQFDSSEVTKEALLASTADHVLQGSAARHLTAGLGGISRPSEVTVDLVFAMDCTGSMGGWITGCKEHTRGIVASIAPRVQKDHPDVTVNFRFAHVGYRDVCDGSNLYNIQKFTTSIRDIETHVSGAKRQDRVSGSTRQ